MFLFDNRSETTQHILQCTMSLESIQPGGEGHASSIRVRLLHAAVRQKIMKLAHQRPDYYNVKEYGRYPIVEEGLWILVEQRRYVDSQISMVSQVEY